MVMLSKITENFFIVFTCCFFFMIMELISVACPLIQYSWHGSVQVINYLRWVWNEIWNETSNIC